MLVGFEFGFREKMWIILVEFGKLGLIMMCMMHSRSSETTALTPQSSGSCTRVGWVF